MAYLLRPVQPGDVTQVHALILALAEFENLTHLVAARESDLEAALFGPRARVEALVAEFLPGDEHPGGIVGFALYFHNYSTFLGRAGLYLEDLFVDPAHRRKGIAKAMLRRLAAIAVERGCGRFEWSVLDWNSGAIAFYQGIGAQILPDWRIVRITGDALRTLGDATPADVVRRP